MRQKTFNDEDVLTTIMYLFWNGGYQGTSMDEIVNVTNIQKQSLYNAFGDKKSLFLKSLYFYHDDTTAVIKQIASDSKDTSAFLHKSFDFLIDRHKLLSCPSGCFVLKTISEFGQSDPAVTKAINEITEEFDWILEEMIAKGQVEHTITNTMGIPDIMAYLKGIFCGCIVLGQKGDPPQSIRKMAYLALQQVCT